MANNNNVKKDQNRYTPFRTLNLFFLAELGSHRQALPMHGAFHRVARRVGAPYGTLCQVDNTELASGADYVKPPYQLACGPGHKLKRYFGRSDMCYGCMCRKLSLAHY